MLYFLYGDVSKAAQKARSMVDALLLKQPDAARFKIDSQNWSEGDIEGLLHGQGLFSQRYIIEFRHLSETSDTAESVISFLPEISESENIFIWVDRDISAKHLKEIEKHATKVQEFKSEPKIAKPEFNLFSLGDALIERNKQKLWVLFQDALSFFPAEEIHGTLFWQMKSIALTTRVDNPEDAGMKAFPFNKSKSALKKYSKKEITEMLENLLKVSHEARRGKHDFGVALERWILSI
jgi:DNA polymerase III delta subunit